jgi:NADPH2:quinone reductase
MTVRGSRVWFSEGACRGGSTSLPFTTAPASAIAVECSELFVAGDGSTILAAGTSTSTTPVSAIQGTASTTTVDPDVTVTTHAGAPAHSGSGTSFRSRIPSVLASLPSPTQLDLRLHAPGALRGYVLLSTARALPNQPQEPALSSAERLSGDSGDAAQVRALQARRRSVKHTRIIVTHYGGPEALQVIEEECPEPKEGEVRVRVLAAGVSLPDIMAREGVHPETPSVPFTPGWDLVGVVDRLGDGVSGIEPGQMVTAMPISGAYAQFVCLPQRELIPVPSGLDAAEAVSLVLNYVTAYQMLHRSAKVRRSQRVLIHGAAGGVGTALLQLGRLAELAMYGTCSSGGALAVSNLGGIPIDYRELDFVKEIRRLTNEGVDAVFDPIGGTHLWRSRKALRPGGRVVGYGLTTSLRGEGLTSSRPGRRQRFRGTAIFGLYIAGGRVLPGRKRVVPYSIQWLKRLKPALFRQDLIALLDLLQQQRIKPLVAQRIPLAEARHAQELLGKGGVTGKIVLVCNGSSLESGAAQQGHAEAGAPRRGW